MIFFFTLTLTPAHKLMNLGHKDLLPKKVGKLY